MTGNGGGIVKRSASSRSGSTGRSRVEEAGREEGRNETVV